MTRPKFKYRTRKTTHLLGLIIIIGFGCASNPENIKPSYVSALRYKKFTCEELLIEHSDLISRYVVAAKVQKEVATQDVVGVILLGFPVAGSDNIDYEIASLKGNILAVRKSLIEKDCGLQPIPENISNHFVDKIAPKLNINRYSNRRFMDFNLRQVY